MGFRDFILGSAQERAATETMRNVPKRQLSYDEALALHSARVRWVGLRTRQAALAIVALGAGFGARVLLEDEPALETPRVELSAPPSSTPEVSTEEAKLSHIRSIYDTGFDELMKTVPDQATEGNDALSTLSTFKNFGNNEVKWARVEGRGYFALEEGQRAAAYTAVVPPSHPLAQNPKTPLLSVNDSNPSIRVLNIMPYEAVPLWAGVYKLHELVHLFDQAKGVEPLNPSREQYLAGEARAYEIELLGLDHYSQGRYHAAVQGEVDRLGFKTMNDLIAFQAASNEALYPSYRALDAAVDGKSPASEQEGGLRMGLHVMALGRELVARNTKTSEEAQTAFAQFISQLMSQDPNQGKNVPKQ